MKNLTKPANSNPQFGVSFSVKQCRSFSMEWRPVLRALRTDLGVRRFRLMSYWNEHESEQGTLRFKELDDQIAMIAKHGGVITLCLGARQPRWPENHWPEWAWNLPKAKRDKALLAYVEAVVKRYKDNPAIMSYQLENEALLEQFGERPEVDRNRLNSEYNLVKHLDPSRPIIMTTSTSWGIPVRNPIPDIVGFSYYQVLYRDGRYTLSFHRPWLDKLRALTIKILHRKPSFIHELQAEPWGPQAIWEMLLDEQFKSMSLDQLKANIRQAKATGLYPIDLWGAEWWCWLKTIQHDPSIWNVVKQQFTVE
jgi:hypothetical protein